jgi:hypothetical protein
MFPNCLGKKAGYLRRFLARPVFAAAVRFDFALLRGGFFTADFLAVPLRETAANALRLVRPVPFLPFEEAFFFGERRLLTALRALFATVDTASPTALPAVTAKSLAPLRPALAVSTTAPPVSTTASFTLVSMVSFSFPIVPPYS